MSMKPTPRLPGDGLPVPTPQDQDQTPPAVYSSADWFTVVRLIAEGCPVVSVTNTGSHCPLVEFDNSDERTASLAEFHKNHSIVPAIERLAKLAQNQPAQQR